MLWRFIPFKHYDPFVKIALNQVAIDSVKKTGRPIVWLAGWKPSCVNIGFGQKIRDVLNLEEVKKQNLVVVRRQGGGGAMYLSEHGEISWAIIAPEQYFPKNLNEIYTEICGKVISALREIGISASHKPINDIVTRNGKVSGTTVKKEHGVVYVAGTLLYDIDAKLLTKLLRPENDSLKRKSVPEKEKKVSAVSQESNASFSQTLQSLKANLLKEVPYLQEEWSSKELAFAEELAKKYRSKEWVYQI